MTLTVNLDRIHSQQKEHLGTTKPVNQIEPMVSVFVTAYQHAQFIAQCLEGILMQKIRFPMEIVLGEDQSTDGTREICLEYADHYPDKIRLFLRERSQTVQTDASGSFFKSLNGTLTLRSCRGKYIAMCEGDDYWTDPLKLQKQVDFLKSNPEYVLCFHNMWVAHKKSKDDYFLNHGLSRDSFAAEDIITGAWFIGTASTVFRNIIQDFPPWFLKAISGDIALHLLLVDKGKFKYIDEVMGVYRRYGDGLSAFYGGDRFTAVALPNRIEMYEAFNLHTQRKYEAHIRKKIDHYLALIHNSRSARRRSLLLTRIFNKLPVHRIELKRRIKRFLDLHYDER